MDEIIVLKDVGLSSRRPKRVTEFHQHRIIQPLCEVVGQS